MSVTESRRISGNRLLACAVSVAMLSGAVLNRSKLFKIVPDRSRNSANPFAWKVSPETYRLCLKVESSLEQLKQQFINTQRVVRPKWAIRSLEGQWRNLVATLFSDTGWPSSDSIWFTSYGTHIVCYPTRSYPTRRASYGCHVVRYIGYNLLATNQPSIVQRWSEFYACTWYTFNTFQMPFNDFWWLSIPFGTFDGFWDLSMPLDTFATSKTTWTLVWSWRSNS